MEVCRQECDLSSSPSYHWLSTAITCAKPKEIDIYHRRTEHMMHSIRTCTCSTIKESDEMGCSVPPGDGTTREGDGFVVLLPLLPLL